MNKVILVGNLTKDPELMETLSGTMLCKFTIAVNRSYVNEDGSRDADFFNVNVWRAKAESCGKYLNKGSKVAIVGELRSRSYEDEAGIKHYVTEIQANEVEFLTPKNAQGENYLKDDEATETKKTQKAKAEKVKETKVKTKKEAKKSKREQMEAVDEDLPF